MNILIASDDNYISPALVMIKSLIHNNGGDIHIYYLYEQLKKQVLKDL